MRECDHKGPEERTAGDVGDVTRPRPGGSTPESQPEEIDAMPDKPSILCTRRMPPNVEARLARDYDATLNPDDDLYCANGLVAGQRGTGRDLLRGRRPDDGRGHRPAS